MTKEQFYDEEIAPVLRQLAEKCKEQRLSFLATCEFAPGDCGHTMIFAENVPSATLRLIRMAMWALGNVDSLIGRIIADAAIHGHNSAYLSMLEKK